MAMAATRSSCSSPCAPAIAPGGVAMLLLLMLSGRAADAQAPNTCLTSTACLPEGAIACSTTSECATGCTAGAAYAICTVEIGIAIDGQAYCLEGLAPGTNNVPTDVCTEPDAHSFLQARAAAWNLRAARACATASHLTLCPHCARGSATRASPSASAVPRHAER